MNRKKLDHIVIGMFLRFVKNKNNSSNNVAIDIHESGGKKDFFLLSSFVLYRSFVRKERKEKFSLER